MPAAYGLSHLADARSNVIWGAVRHDEVEMELVLNALQRRIHLVLEDTATKEVTRSAHKRVPR